MYDMKRIKIFFANCKNKMQYNIVIYWIILDEYIYILFVEKHLVSRADDDYF